MVQLVSLRAINVANSSISTHTLPLGCQHANLSARHSNDVARGAGYVMDHCVRAGSDWVQGSEYAHGNGNLLVRIRRP